MHIVLGKRQISGNFNVILICMYLFYPALENFIWKITSTVTMNRVPRPLVNALIWAVIIFVPSLKRIRINRKQLALLAFLIIISVVSFFITEYAGFTINVLGNIIFVFIPATLYGCFLEIDEKDLDVLYIVAIISFALSASLSLLMGATVDGMYISYQVLPTTLLIIAYAFYRGINPACILLISSCFVFHLMCGSRGPIVCMGAFVCLMIYKKYGLSRTITMIILGIFLLMAFVMSTGFQLFLDYIIATVSGDGASTRILGMIQAGSLSGDSGRSSLISLLQEKMVQNPYMIRGFYADRVATAGFRNYDIYLFVDELGVYAHSFVWELIYDFGLILGTAMVLWIVVKAVKLVLHCSYNRFLVPAILIASVLVKLLFSNSLLTEKGFFLLLGIMTNHFYFSNMKMNGKRIVTGKAGGYVDSGNGADD